MQHNLQGLLDRHLSRPFHRACQRVATKVRDIYDLLDVPAAYDQYPGRVIPKTYTSRFGPIPLTTPRRYDNGSDNGFEKLATVATPATPYLRQGNEDILIDTRGRFRWLDSAIHTYFSWTWNGTAGVPPANVREFDQFGDLFDAVFPQNGGAMLMNNNRFVDLGLPANAEDVPNASFEIGIWDKKRGRYLHDGTRLPSALFSGQNFCNRTNAEGIPFPRNSAIQPQLYVNEVAIRQYLNTDDLFNAAEVKVYVIFTMLGVEEQEDDNR